MNKVREFLMIVGVMTGVFVQAEVVITSSTGVADESDVVLEKVVDSVREAPVDAVALVGDTVDFVIEEVRNTAQGVTAAFEPEPPQTVVSENLLMDVEQAWNEAGRIQMKTFTVSDLIAKEMSGAAGSGGAKVDVRPFFQEVDFPEGCSADYWPKFKRLVIRQTAAGMLKVVDLLAEHQEKPDYRQIEIETKFIEVEQKTLNELGFDWNFSDSWNVDRDVTVDLVNQTLSGTLRTAAEAFYGAGSAGTLTLTDNGWIPLELTIRALEQSAGADVLSAPSVTTTDGTTAQIWVGDRELMPTEFSPQADGTSVTVAYDGWRERNIGVHLEVTPTVTDDNLINLALKPEVIDLVDYDTYEITPSNASMLIWGGLHAGVVNMQGRFPIPNIPGKDTAWNIMRATLGGKDPNTTGLNEGNITAEGYYDQRRKLRSEEDGIAVPQLTGALPVFRVRKIDTNMTVADGSTVGMGGLIYDKLETYKDKVPVLGSIPLLGRLFRSEGERSVKRNLMIFVTATQVDVNGRRSVDLANR